MCHVYCLHKEHLARKVKIKVVTHRCVVAMTPPILPITAPPIASPPVLPLMTPAPPTILPVFRIPQDNACLVREHQEGAGVDDVAED